MTPSSNSEPKDSMETDETTPATKATASSEKRKSIESPTSAANEGTKKSVSKSEEKLSGAELKKRKQAEKASRRQEQAKQNANGGTRQVSALAAKDDAKRHNESEEHHAAGGSGAQRRQQQGLKDDPNVKSSDKGRGSGASESSKSVPLRGVLKRTTSQPTAPQEEKEVGLFGHLYGQPRRTTIIGAARDVHPAILALGLQWSSYGVCGSNARCVFALHCFKKVIDSYTTPPGATLTRHLTTHLSPQIDYLRSCRPLPVNLGNAIRWLKLEISKIDINTSEPEAKSYLNSAIDNFIRDRITVADKVIATSGADKIKDGDVVLTFAKSSLVERTLTAAFDRGVKFRVIVVDSKPLFEGRQLARNLASLGLEVKYSLMHAIAHDIKDASKVFLGAHAMMSNGRLYSRVGTAAVAMMAHEADVPVIVCCESLKFTEHVALDSVVSNEVAPPDEIISPTTTQDPSPSTPFAGLNSSRQRVSADQTNPATSSSPLSNWRETPNLQLLNIMYDVTPAEYIKMVITEFGSLPPSSVPVVHRLSTNT